MKKWTVFLLAMICILALSGCGSRSMNDIIQNEPSITGIVTTITEDTFLMNSEKGEY